jgi:hypothetical protein
MTPHEVVTKKMKTQTLVLVMLMMMPIAIGLSSAAPQITATETVEPVVHYHVLETLTIYHPEEGQCDSTPLITANNSHIDLDKLRRNEIRWMALSRDLLKRWNGEFNYGDTVILEAGDSEIDGLWVINDSMNKRFNNRGDLLFHRDSRTTGIWRNVKMNKMNLKVAG